MIMTMFLSILVYVVLIINLELRKKRKLEIDCFKYSSLRLRFLDKNMFICFFWVLFFVLGYMVFIRFLRLFRDSEYIDLILINEKLIQQLEYYNTTYIQIFIFFICYVILIRSLKNNLLIFFKKNFLSLNYYWLVNSYKYEKIYIYMTHWHRIVWYWLLGSNYNFKNRKKVQLCIYFFFKYLGYAMLIICLLLDLYLNKYKLILFSTLLPWFGIYQMLYSIHNFFDLKIIYDMEVISYNCIYNYEIKTKKIKEEYFTNRTSETAEHDIIAGDLIDIFNSQPNISYLTITAVNNYIKMLLK